ELEDLILRNCVDLKPEVVLPDQDEAARACAAYRQTVVGRVRELENITRQLDNLVNSVADEDNKVIRQRLRDKMEALEERRKQVEAEKAEAEQLLVTAEQGLASFSKWRSGLDDLRKGISENPELRVRLRTHLRQFIERVDVFPTGKVGDRDFRYWLVDAIAEYNPGWKPDEQFVQFVKYVEARRRTREGRFVRVFFKTKRLLDLVPEGSLAFGVELLENGDREGRRIVRPMVEKLWNDFQASVK
ncbi:MAG: hypothetical protein ACYC6Y_26100, partial [Thermoguttaceae bacterium]